MNLYSNETVFLSITKFNETSYQVCYDAPPHTTSDGLWGGQHNGRTPMKSIFPLFELQVLVIFAITQICRFLLKPLGLPLFISQMMVSTSIYINFFNGFHHFSIHHGPKNRLR